MLLIPQSENNSDKESAGDRVRGGVSRGGRHPSSLLGRSPHRQAAQRFRGQVFGSRVVPIYIRLLALPNHLQGSFWAAGGSLELREVSFLASPQMLWSRLELRGEYKATHLVGEDILYYIFESCRSLTMHQTPYVTVLGPEILLSTGWVNTV